MDGKGRAIFHLFLILGTGIYYRMRGSLEILNPNQPTHKVPGIVMYLNPNLVVNLIMSLSST